LEDRLATSLILLCAGGTQSSRTGGFPSPDEALDKSARRDAANCRLDARFHANLFVSSARSALETVDAMNLRGRREPALADVDHGSWAGRSFEAVLAEMPDDLMRWLANPVDSAPGGEPMDAVTLRIGRWLDRIACLDQPICAITHATVIRAALAHTLDLPLRSTLAIDIAPLSRTRLSFNRAWRLQSLTPFD